MDKAIEVNWKKFRVCRQPRVGGEITRDFIPDTSRDGSQSFCDALNAEGGPDRYWIEPFCVCEGETAEDCLLAHLASFGYGVSDAVLPGCDCECHGRKSGERCVSTVILRLPGGARFPTSPEMN